MGSSYRNDYFVYTADDVLDNLLGQTFQYISFLGWAIPSEFFNPDNDAANFLVNNQTFRPTDVAGGGSGGYVEIRCRNGAVCVVTVESGESTLGT